VNVFETTFGEAALDGHLTTFVAHFALITGAALATFVTFGRSTTFTGGFTTAEAFLFVYGAFGRLQIVQLHCIPIFDLRGSSTPR
jgi:hypothetical protein